MRVHLVLAAGVLIAGGLTGLGGVELAVLALTIGLVLVAELLNTALENVTDYVHPDAGPVAAVVKDVAAAAVLVSVVLAVCVAVFVFAPHFDFFVASRTVPLVLAAACLARAARPLRRGPAERARLARRDAWYSTIVTTATTETARDPRSAATRDGDPD